MSDEKQLKLVIADYDGYGGCLSLAMATLDAKAIDKLIYMLARFKSGQKKRASLTLPGSNKESYEDIAFMPDYFLDL